MDPSLHLSQAHTGVENRLFKFCETLFSYDLSDLSERACSSCHRFYVACCSHYTQPRYFPCHHFKLVFTDGACLNNGRDGPRAGIGAIAGQAHMVAYEDEDGDEDGDASMDRNERKTPDLSQVRVKRVDDTLDPGMPRTNQRAELLGALEGLDLLYALWKENRAEAEREGRPVHGEAKIHRSDREDFDRDLDLGKQEWAVATDSEYVVKGITQWYPAWRRRGWITANGKRPTNLDLFHRLNAKLDELEAMNIQVGFWRIPREYNQLADQLAGEAALM